uniref:Rapid alkalinization factor 5 n=1 Tax=Solanum chacoense TaxID=4108 RepID=Q6DN46_SOLCH|nr:rapid alkalinization factor 5 [Solanum chacoense]
MGRELYKMMLLVLLVTVIKVEAVSECNGTSSSIGACLVDVDEFLMESETSTRILAGGNARSQKLNYKAAGNKAAICKEKIVGNCIGNKNVKATHCNFGNRCKRVISH